MIKTLAATYGERKRDYVARLILDHAITQLDNGSFGNVFQHPTMPDVVIKVFEDEDRAYWNYLTWCQKHQSNPYAPRILQVVDPENFDSYHPESENPYNFTIVFMEKLVPLSVEDENKWVLNLPWDAAYLEKRPSMRDIRMHIGNVVSFSQLDPSDWHALSTQTKDHNLAQVAAFIADAAYRWARLDLRNKNLMRRGNQLVFVDPVAIPLRRR